MAVNIPTLDLDANPNPASQSARVTLQASAHVAGDRKKLAGCSFEWRVPKPSGALTPTGGVIQADANGNVPDVVWDTGTLKAGVYDLELVVTRASEDNGNSETLTLPFTLEKAAFGPGDTIPITPSEGSETQPFNVSLQRAAIVDTPDLPLWNIIRRSCELLSFNRFKQFTDFVVCGEPLPKDLPFGQREGWTAQQTEIKKDDPYPRTRLPFPHVESYRLLKAATEAFLMVNCGVEFAPGQFARLRLDIEEQEDRLGLRRGDTLGRLMRAYVVDIPDNDGTDAFIETIPYLALVRGNIDDVQFGEGVDAELCYRILREKLTHPCFLELIWSYWHEEGMLPMTMNAISMRVQNRAGRRRPDPLSELAVDPLRPLNNLLWGYIQDEPHRLSMARRLYEYDHEYGLTLYGRAVPRVRGADTRSKFLEAFHTLLHRASVFYKDDDDATTIADPFPVLNALRDVHLLLAEGAHNQYGDLPWTARHEMLMQQWLLSRPELREFLPTRVMVAYPEPWMGRVDAMKRLQGWTDTSVRYFHDLGVFGEQVLLSIRFGDWSNVFDREQAGNWARYWRQEVQWYIHAYQTVTGVDLSADMRDVRQAELRPDRYMQPAFHLQRRLVQQRRRLAAQDGAVIGGRARIELEQGVVTGPAHELPEGARHEIPQ